jgi:SAM-dependent methyltransferase
MEVRKRTTCAACGGSQLKKVLDLGHTPLANSFVRAEDVGKPEGVYPLALAYCPQCHLVQLDHIVPREKLFNDTYFYESGASEPLVKHFHAFADEIADEHAIDKDHLVVEIGSNDGSLLSHIKDRLRVLGVDPSENVARKAIERGVPTVVGFFGTDTALKLREKHGPARVIVANNVMAHIDDIRDAFSGARELLEDEGKFIFEVHWLGDLVSKGGFDQIYHEHLYYHSLHALKNLLASIGMVLVDVKIVPVHGESLRVYAQKGGESSTRVRDLLLRELELGLTNEKTFEAFAGKIAANREKLITLLRELKLAGNKIAGYGAPGKGNTLLNFFHIDGSILDYIVDTTPAKQGTFTPGTMIPVVAPERLKQDRPDYLLLLSWNYADAILEKERELRESGTKFIIPVPEIRVI